MATKSKKNVRKDQAGTVSDSPVVSEGKADSRAAGPDTVDEATAIERFLRLERDWQNSDGHEKIEPCPPGWQKALWKKRVGVQESDESVEERYNATVERCGLNMPLLLQEILRELMYLRAGK